MEKERDSHRNGIAGLGFNVWLEEGAIGVKFYGSSDIVVPFSEFEEMMALPLTDKVSGPEFRSNTTTFRWAKKFGDVYLCAYDSKDEDEAARSMIGIYDPRLDDVPFATFDWDLVKKGEVRFCYNSWRGDSMLDGIERAIGMKLDAWVNR
jgi:hypothetical protein